MLSEGKMMPCGHGKTRTNGGSAKKSAKKVGYSTKAAAKKSAKKVGYSTKAAAKKSAGTPEESED